MKPLLVDDLDRQIISLLRENPRITNREVGDRVGQSERLVASRIAALQANDIMRVVVQRDVASLGDDLLGLVNIFVQGRDVRDVAQEIRDIEEVSSLVLLLGPPQLAAMVHARDREHLHELISGPFSKIRGIHKIDADIMLNVWKYRSDLAMFDL